MHCSYPSSPTLTLPHTGTTCLKTVHNQEIQSYKQTNVKMPVHSFFMPWGLHSYNSTRKRSHPVEYTWKYNSITSFESYLALRRRKSPTKLPRLPNLSLQYFSVTEFDLDALKLLITTMWSARSLMYYHV